MHEGPELSAACHFEGLGVNGHDSTAWEWSNVWSSLFIERKIPSCDRFASISQCFGKDFRPMSPVAEVIGTRVVWPTLSPVHTDLWKLIFHLLHHLGFSHISVPGNVVAELAQTRILQ